jgi:hypothetical protein
MRSPEGLPHFWRERKREGGREREEKGNGEMGERRRAARS